MKRDHRIEALDLPEEARELIRGSEITGSRTFIVRDGREVAVVISHDEYVALRETVSLVGDDAARDRLRAAEEETAQGRLLLPEELFGLEGRFGNDRLRIAEGAWSELDESRKEVVRAAFVEIDANPLSGAPLFPPLRPWWSCRNGSLRIVYRVAAEGRIVAVLGIDFDPV
jgi:PHD/YefM family antitoxin component YafN of YafNO toxin-antitoxin module/mRNA-degrading endonuclease RelE of RelBE toxin-antitoxin system